MSFDDPFAPGRRLRRPTLSATVLRWIFWLSVVGIVLALIVTNWTPS